MTFIKIAETSPDLSDVKFFDLQEILRSLKAGMQLRIKNRKERKVEVPVWEKATLSLDEAAAYSGIGIHKLRQLTDAKNCSFVLWNGSKRLIKRKKLDEYLDNSYSI